MIQWRTLDLAQKYMRLHDFRLLVRRANSPRLPPSLQCERLPVVLKVLQPERPAR